MAIRRLSRAALFVFSQICLAVYPLNAFKLASPLTPCCHTCAGFVVLPLELQEDRMISRANSCGQILVTILTLMSLITVSKTYCTTGKKSVFWKCISRAYFMERNKRCHMHGRRCEDGHKYLAATEHHLYEGLKTFIPKYVSRFSHTVLFNILKYCL